MKFNSHLNCGDTAWIFYGRYCEGPQEAVVGKITFEYTDTVLYEDSETGYGEPVKELKEKYMCKETGVGSGTVFTYGEHIFKTREECEAKFAERIAEIAREKADAIAREIKKKLDKEQLLRIQLAEIEELKKGVVNG